MNAFVMTFRNRGQLHRHPLLAASMADAWARAFDLAEALGGSQPIGFAVRRAGIGA